MIIVAQMVPVPEGRRVQRRDQIAIYVPPVQAEQGAQVERAVLEALVALVVLVVLVVLAE